MHWLIDGNNLMHLLPEVMWASDTSGQPAALAALIKPYRDAKALKLTIFFDGGDEYRQARLSGVPVVFSGPAMSADKAILQRLQKQPGQGLISNDRALISEATRLGAKTMSANAFAQKLKTSQGADDDDRGWNFSTRKKGPSRRLSKARRRRDNILKKL